MRPLCPCCNSEMQASTTTFTVAKRDSVYVVRNVPCWECLSCGQMIHDQAVAERLEQYMSGRAAPRRNLLAWEYQWGDEIVRIPKFSEPVTTDGVTCQVLLGARMGTA